MSVVKINGKDAGLVGHLIAIPILVLTFLWVAIIFLLVALFLLSPFILIGLLVTVLL